MYELECGTKMLVQWYPRNYFQLSSVAPIIVVFLGANGNVNDRYAKVLAKYIAKRGWRCCLIIRKGFGQHKLNTGKFMNQEEFHEFHECILKVDK